VLRDAAQPGSGWGGAVAGSGVYTVCRARGADTFCACTGDKSHLDAGDVIGQGAADDGGQSMLEPVEGQGADELDGPGAVRDVDDAAAPQAVVKGGAGHLPAEGFQDLLPSLFHLGINNGT
jgi:hypothetical protein